MQIDGIITVGTSLHIRMLDQKRPKTKQYHTEIRLYLDDLWIATPVDFLPVVKHLNNSWPQSTQHQRQQLSLVFPLQTWCSYWVTLMFCFLFSEALEFWWSYKNRFHCFKLRGGSESFIKFHRSKPLCNHL